MFGFHLPEILLFSAIALLLFGSRVPHAMRSLGLGISEFKKGLKETGAESGES